MSIRKNRTTTTSGAGCYDEAPELDPNVTDDLLVDLMKGATISDPNDPNVENQRIDWEKERAELDRYFDHQSK